MATSENHIQFTPSYHAHFLSVPEPKPIKTLDEFQNSKSLNYLKVQTSDDRAELIRSNKTIMKRNLKNSLQTKLLAIPINPKEENLTAASLKDLDSDQYGASKRLTSLKCVTSIKSEKSFNSEIQQIVQQSFEDNFHFIKKIGQGAHSTVYKTLCKSDNKQYAFKKIKNVSFQNFKKMKNLYKMFKQMDHQNIIKFHQFHFDQEKKTAFIVMEYCEFNDLRSQIQKRQISGEKFSKNQVLEITKNIASVLEYLHSEGICHRDLKPENILYDSMTKSVKVIDLDVCGVKKNKSQKFDLWTNTGTLFYRAPETFGIGYTEKADIWSLGAIIYELITGQVPFHTEYEKDFLRKIKAEKIDFDRIQLGSKMTMILKRCLQKDPQLRVSARQLLDMCQNKIKDDQHVSSKKSFATLNVEKTQDDFHLGHLCLGGILKHAFY